MAAQPTPSPVPVRHGSSASGADHPLGSAVARLEQALAEVTAACNGLADLPDDGLGGLVARLQRASSRLAAASAAVAGEWDERKAWRRDGHRSASSGLATISGADPRTARRALRRARAMRSMPSVAVAVLHGRLSVDHLDLLSRADQPWRHDTFRAHEDVLVREIEPLRWDDATRVVDYWVQRVDAGASAEEARLRGLSEHCWVSPLLDGMTKVDATLAGVGGEIVGNEIHRLERIEYRRDVRDGVQRTASQRRAAALVQMALRSARRGRLGEPARAAFTVLVGDHTARHLCQLASGRVVHPTELLPHIDTAVMESVLFDGPTTVVGVSSQRSFTGALRRAIIARDRFCTHPSGCDVPAERCDIDHIVPWALGGPTRQENGRARCSTHNRDPEMVGPPTRPAPFRHHDRTHLERLRRRWREAWLADEDIGPPTGG